MNTIYKPKGAAAEYGDWTIWAGGRMGGGEMDRLTNHDPNRRLVACRANYESWNAIYDRLAAYEDTGLTPAEVWRVNAESSEFSRIIALGNCNTCAKKRSCEYAPGLGETVRINCPLFEAEAVLGGGGRD